MRKTKRALMAAYITNIVVALIIVVMGETDCIVEKGIVADDEQGQFVWAIVMELLTICVIPIDLKMFHFSLLKRRITSPEKLLVWGLVRIELLALPMIINTVLYYAYYNVAFGYMGIILFLCMFFITPTRQRCEEEISKLEA